MKTVYTTFLILGLATYLSVQPHGSQTSTDSAGKETTHVSALHNAVSYNDALRAAHLISWKAPIDIKDHNGNTELLAALKNNNALLADFLIRNGADVNARNNKGESPLFIGILRLLEQSRYNDEYHRVIKSLLGKGANPNAQRNTDGATPFILALFSDIDEEITKELAVRGGCLPQKELFSKEENTPSCCKIPSFFDVAALHTSSSQHDEHAPMPSTSSTEESTWKQHTMSPPSPNATTNVPRDHARASNRHRKDKTHIKRQRYHPYPPIKPATQQPDHTLSRTLEADEKNTLSALSRKKTRNTEPPTRYHRFPKAPTLAFGSTLPRLKQTGPSGYSFHLRAAAREGNVAKMKEVLTSCLANNVKIKIDGLPPHNCQEGETALHKAARNGHVHAVKLLLSHGADPCLEDTTGKTALAHARSQGHKTCAELLSQHGRDTVLGSQLLHALQFRCPTPNNLIERIEEEGIDVTVRGAGQQSLLHALAKPNPRSLLLSKIIQHGANMECKDEQRRTPLALGAEKSTPSFVNTLLNNGANVNTYDAHGNTPLHKSLKNRRIVEALIEHGADVNAVNHSGVTPLMQALDENTRKHVVLHLINAGARIPKQHTLHYCEILEDMNISRKKRNIALGKHADAA